MPRWPPATATPARCPDPPPRLGSRERSPRRREGLRRFWDDFWTLWEEASFDPVEFLERGDRVLVRLRLSGRARDGLETTHTMGHLWTMRDGVGAHLRSYWDLDEGRRALAHSEQPA